MGRFDVETEVRSTRTYTKPYEEFTTHRTVTVWLDHSRPTSVQPFRCTVCGNIVFEHSGDVAMLVSGHYVALESHAERPIQLIQCSGTYIQRDPFGDVRRRNCHARYQLC